MSEPMAALSDARGVDLLGEIIQEIERHELSTWFQELWIWREQNHVDSLSDEVRETLVPTFDCGTKACIYGHAVFKAGATFCLEGSHISSEYVMVDGTYRLCLEGSHISSEYVMVDGTYRLVDQYANELFGLPVGFSSWLSYSQRTWHEIVAFYEAWKLDAAEGPDSEAHRQTVIERYEHY